MFCITLRAKSIIAFFTFFILSALLFFSGDKITSVFKAGNREIPIYSVERPDDKIALTFNCAWNDSDIDKIIDILKRNNVPATFFAVGDWAEKYPESLKKLYDNGFEIGNHSYNHAHYKKMSKDEILIDIQKCDDVITNITGEKPSLFRAAYGEYNDDVVLACEETGRTYIQWSADSIDYKAKSAAEITNRVLEKTKKGDIILMHNGTDHTAEALETLVPKLCEKFALVKVSDLIYTKNFTIAPDGRQHPAEQ